jgi:hypothetical protein
LLSVIRKSIQLKRRINGRFQFYRVVHYVQRSKIVNIQIYSRITFDYQT